MRNDWVKYVNGNYCVYFNKKNGTKIRRCDEAEIMPDFPENCDILISTMCDKECPWCYAECSKNGSFGNLTNWKFLENIHPYTELALNLNFPVHPELEKFLYMMKDKEVFVNLTVNHDHLMDNIDYVKSLRDKGLFYGLGVSYTAKCTDESIRIITETFDNVVFHVINGLFTPDDFNKMKNKGLKILMLGYKDFGRGTTWFHNYDRCGNIGKNFAFVFDYLLEILNGFELVSFDNLALEQIQVRKIVSDTEWATNYMGDDATVTFAINLVKGTFSPNSMSKTEYPIGDKTLEEMLKIVREK